MVYRVRMGRRRNHQPAEPRDITALALAVMRRLFPKSDVLREFDAKHGIAHATVVLGSASLRITTGQPFLRTKPVVTSRRRHHAVFAKAVIVQPMVVFPRCAERGCAFPAIVGQRCRQHASDMVAERSTIPSVQRPVLSGLRFHA